MLNCTFAAYWKLGRFAIVNDTLLWAFDWMDRS
jgi:hypothetical protein